jgi:dTDP-4-dehydrorhamnose reductase
VSTKVLILGASGLIGSCLLLKLGLSDGLSVLGTSRKLSNEKTVKVASLQDYREILLKWKPDVIILAIGSASVDFADSNPLDSMKQNLFDPMEIVKIILLYSPKSRVFLLSTIYVFSGSENQGHLTEDVTPQPSSSYGIQKYKLEKYISEAIRNSVLIRLPMIIGNNMHPGDFFNQLINTLSKSEKYPLSNDSLRYPTDIFFVAETIKKIIISNIVGTIHISSKYAITKYMLAYKFLVKIGIDPTSYLEVLTKDQHWRRPYSLKISSTRGFEFPTDGFCWSSIVPRYCKGQSLSNPSSLICADNLIHGGAAFRGSSDH